jgi:hypothetical protein
VDWYSQLQLLKLMQNVIGTDNPLVLSSEPVADDQLREYLLRAEEASREGVDAAVRAFSRSGKWPELSPTEKYFISQRIEFAVWVTLALAATDEQGRSIIPDPPETLEKEDQVEWLLVWAWRTPGHRFWIEKSRVNELLARATKEA